MNKKLQDLAMQTGTPVPKGAVAYQAVEGPLPVAGAGTRASWDGQSLIALTEGLVIAGAGGVCVLEAQLREGNVEPGHMISAPGNLVITGNVGPEAEIRARGFVVVMGPVFSARIAARGSVVLRSGCTGSTVEAGANRQLYEMAGERVRMLEAALRRLIVVLDQLGNHPRFRTMDLQVNLRPLLEILVERNFAGLPSEVAEVLRRLQGLAHTGGPVSELVALLGRRFEGVNLLHTSRPVIEQACGLSAAAAGQLAELGTAPFSVTVTNGPVLESTLSAPGDVTVAGGDCRRAHITGGAVVRVEGRISSGSVFAGRAIVAHSLSDDPAVEVKESGVVGLRGSLGTPTIRIGHLVIRVPGACGPCVIRQVGDRLEILTGTEESAHA